MPTHDTQTGFRLLVTPDRPALVADHPTTLRVLVRVQAPTPSGKSPARRPLHLALALDRSGSMSGPPLDEARRCARYIIDNLAPGDRAAILAFDDEIDLVAPLTLAENKLALASALDAIRSGGSTDLHGGWRAGAEELAGKLSGDDVPRVILLSDGCANLGETDTEVIAGQCKAYAQRGVATSTYGLGRDFNESLMLAMASAGRGNAYYGETAADLAEPFAAEFALLASLCARGLVLKVSAPPTVAVRLRNEYEPVERNALTWRLPDLAFASEAWALLELVIQPSILPGSGPAVLPISISVQAATSESAPLFLMTSLPALLIVDHARWQAMAVDPVVARRTLELEAADALVEVRAAIEAEEWAHARQLVVIAEQRFAGHEWAAAIIETMKRLIGERDKRLAAKESAFAVRNMRGRLASVNEPQAGFTDDAATPLFLRRKSAQGKGRLDS